MNPIVLFICLISISETPKEVIATPDSRESRKSEIARSALNDEALSLTPIRRRWALHAEGALNGLSGTMGLLGSYRLNHKFHVDAGLGINPYRGLGHIFRRIDYQLGARGRYSFFPEPVTPFVALGLTYAQHLFLEDGAHTQTLRVPAAVGVSFATEKGFSALLSLGVAPRIASIPSVKAYRDTDRAIQGVFDALNFLDVLGPSLSVGLGYAF